MDKEAVVHIHNGILLSHKKERIWICSNEVDETGAIILCEVSQKEKYKYTDADIWNTERWYWWIYFQGNSGERDIENRPKDMGGEEEGVRELYGESNMEIYNTICEIDSQWEFAVWLRELKQGLCDNLEGWDGEGDRREIREGWA